MLLGGYGELRLLLSYSTEADWFVTTGQHGELMTPRFKLITVY